ncbi:hypothetical protein [Micromonospora polyrhachis]|uniref:Uncharacterized protein n=1 Tax=Micromonospora polyrhachis TaxID=1282883 RepID=A0A7W7STX7_9ACTN|nr:hypothetical protein [Micromonospora polyrhachis]MBB4960922.1 hypothetical protein [Micromonospora polyrhachis]
MGASGWSYFVTYRPDVQEALDDLRARVFADGDYWWVRGEIGTPASDYPNRPQTLDELYDDEWVRESGTHSILDMFHVVAEGEEPDYGTVQPVTAEEAQRCAGTEVLTREHVKAIDGLAERRWFGRCAVLHDITGQPEEIYFWGWSGD